MKLWHECSEAEQTQLTQLLDDMMPYYNKIAVYTADKDWIRSHRERCMSIALSARKLTAAHQDMTPEEAIFSDQLFGQLVTEAWQSVFTDEDKLFFNANLQQAAECFRMGIMMADLPQME